MKRVSSSTYHRMTLGYLVDEWCTAVVRHLGRVQERRTKPGFRVKEMSKNIYITKSGCNPLTHQKTIHSYPDNRKIELHSWTLVMLRLN